MSSRRSQRRRGGDLVVLAGQRCEALDVGAEGEAPFTQAAT